MCVSLLLFLFLLFLSYFSLYCRSTAYILVFPSMHVINWGITGFMGTQNAHYVVTD